MFDTNKMTVRFWPRKNAISTESNDAPLYAQVRINGIRTSDFSIDVSVPYKHWNQKSQLVEHHPLADELNTAIFKEKKKLLRLKEELEESGKIVTAASIRNCYIGYKKARMQKAKSEIKQLLFSKALDSYYKKKEEKEKMSKNTLKNNKTWINNWKDFLKKEKKASLLADDVDMKTLEHFHTFMDKRESKKVSINHISNHYWIAKEALNLAVKEELIQFSKIASIELVYSSNFDPEGLELEQVEKLIMCTQYTEREQAVVYAFLWMCSTGMDYCDYAPLDWTLEKDSGKYWVSYPRQKNAHRDAQPDAVPFVLDFGILIWKKFGKDVSKFPVMSLVEMNRIIKVAARKAGLNFKKKLSSKRARKTYANICANDVGLSDEALIYLLGHTTTKHLRAYRKIKRRRVLSELSKKI